MCGPFLGVFREYFLVDFTSMFFLEMCMKISRFCKLLNITGAHPVVNLTMLLIFHVDP